MYQVDVDNSGMSMETKEYNTTELPGWISFFTNDLLGITNTHSWAKFDSEGNGNVKFWWYPEADYRVISTDYKDYSVVYGCDNWPFNWAPIVHLEETWLLSRKPQLSVSTI